MTAKDTKITSKDKVINFADVAQPIISFSKNTPHGDIVLQLIDTKWVQRLRDISQTANTRLVYMFSEHSRFGHSVGVASLTDVLLDSLERKYPKKIKEYRTAITAAALLHDIAHLAPGSHTAYKTWFPQAKDVHEELGCRVILEDPEISRILTNFSSELPALVCKILQSSTEIPPWTWEVISGGGWNTDRGNWCIVDSVLAGVNYGTYNIPALVESLEITDDDHLAIKENRLDALMHFAISRHAMYRQVYQHRVLMASDTLNLAIASRARDIHSSLIFADETMQKVLDADSPTTLTLNELFQMRESWWRYHLYKWEQEPDEILADLARRLLYRDLFKTVRVQTSDDSKDFLKKAEETVKEAGFDPTYYLHRFQITHMHKGDSKQALKVLREDRSTCKISEAEPLFEHLVKETENPGKTWLAMPKEAKVLLGRER